MTALKRYSQEEDKIILENWWDPSRRDNIVKQLNRTKGSINFRYYSLLKTYNVDPGRHRNNKGKLPTAFVLDSNDTDTISALMSRMDDLRAEIGTLSKVLLRQEDTLNDIKNTLINKPPVNAVSAELTMENKRLKEDMEKARAQYVFQLSNNQKMQEEIEKWMEDFYRLSNLEKLGQLYDFLPKIKKTLEKYTSSDATEKQKA